MHELLIKGQHPTIQSTCDTYGFIHNVMALYEEIIIWNRDSKYENHIPAFSDFMSYEDFTGMIDDLASYELFGVEALFAPLDEESNNKFWVEYENQTKLVLEDVGEVMTFYNMSYCINEKTNLYLNLPIKEVW